MFVRQSKYSEMERRAERAELAYYVLLNKHNEQVEKWNDLVTFTKRYGGRKGIMQMSTGAKQPFQLEDIQRLLMLCHPDKHDGKQMATDMTAKLLKLKEQIK